MSGTWDDFEDSFKTSEPSARISHNSRQQDEPNTGDANESSSCLWGFRTGGRNQDGDVNDEEDNDNSNSDASAFIVVYEKYLDDKQSFVSNRTNNHPKFVNNAQKMLQEWFEREGLDYNVDTDNHNQSQYVCSLKLPIGDHDFEITSDTSSTKRGAIDELTLTACKLLDEAGLLFSWKADNDFDPNRKQRLMEARKEDDIEFEEEQTSKKHHSDRPAGASSASRYGSASKQSVDTYESLMAKWSQTNLSILQLKAKLVKIDMSVKSAAREAPNESSGKRPCVDTANHEEVDDDGKQEAEDEDEEIDPLDAYMSSLDKKTKLSMDDKIQKSRIKSDIQTFEREQERLGRLIELAKPKTKSNSKT